MNRTNIHKRSASIDLQSQEPGGEAASRIELSLMELRNQLEVRGSESDRVKEQLTRLTTAHSDCLVQLESTKEQLNAALKRNERLEAALKLRTAEMKDEMEFRIHELTIQQELTAVINSELRQCLEEKTDTCLKLERNLKALKELHERTHDTIQIQDASQQQQKVVTVETEKTEDALRRQLKEKEEQCRMLMEHMHRLEGNQQRPDDDTSHSKHPSDHPVAPVTSFGLNSCDQMILGMHEWSAQLMKDLSDAKASQKGSSKSPPSEMPPVMSTGDEITQLKEAYHQLKLHSEELKLRLGAAEIESAEWKSMVNVPKNVEAWVSTLSNRIFHFQSEYELMKADFDHEGFHIPTRRKSEARSKQKLTEFADRLRTAKMAEMELYGVLRAMKDDVKKAGWQPEKLEQLLENSRREYRRVYAEGKLQVHHLDKKTAVELQLYCFQSVSYTSFLDGNSWAVQQYLTVIMNTKLFSIFDMKVG